MYRTDLLHKRQSFLFY